VPNLKIMSQLGKRCQLGMLRLGFAPGLVWARFFIKKNVYYSKYSISTYILLFFKCLGRREWMDRIGSVWMTLSQLGKHSQLGFGFGAALARLGFSLK